MVPFVVETIVRSCLLHVQAGPGSRAYSVTRSAGGALTGNTTRKLLIIAIVKSKLCEDAWNASERVAACSFCGPFQAESRLEQRIQGLRWSNENRRAGNCMGRAFEVPGGATAKTRNLSNGGSAGGNLASPGKIESIEQPRILVAHISHSGADRPAIVSYVGKGRSNSTGGRAGPLEESRRE